MTTERNNMDEAIANCSRIAMEHKRSATRILSFVVVVVITFALLAFFFAFQNTLIRPEHPISDTYLYFLLATFVVVFGVLMATYRFHLSEAARHDFFQVGLTRIRIAGNNTKPGFLTEVRKALTERAFDFEKEQGIGLGRKKIPNPLPGHPGLDLSTEIANQVLDIIESGTGSKKRAPRRKLTPPSTGPAA